MDLTVCAADDVYIAGGVILFDPDGAAHGEVSVKRTGGWRAASAASCESQERSEQKSQIPEIATTRHSSSQKPAVRVSTGSINCYAEQGNYVPEAAFFEGRLGRESGSLSEP